MAKVKRALIYTLRPRSGLDARTCPVRLRTIDCTKNHLKEEGRYVITLTLPR